MVRGNRRQRYIKFIVKPTDTKVHIIKSQMIAEIKRKCNSISKKDCKEMGIRLIRFDGENGILKCNHTEKEHAIKLLQSIENISVHDVKIQTTSTSGTIRTLVGNTKKH